MADQPPLRATGIDHVVLKVADGERSVAWYRDRLGMEPVRLDEWRRGEVPFVSVRMAPGTIIDLLEVEGGPQGENVDHVCLTVDARRLDDLAEAGFDVEWGPVSLFGARGQGLGLYVRDPDGHRVELRHYADEHRIEPYGPADRDTAVRWLTAAFGEPRVVSRGRAHDAADLDGFVAWVGDERRGLATHRDHDDERELVALVCDPERHGTGRALVEAVLADAWAAARRRVWLVTTNDNVDALAFYQRLGADLVGLHRHAVDEARALKPSIPPTGAHGIVLRHELELAWIRPDGASGSVEP